MCEREREKIYLKIFLYKWLVSLFLYMTFNKWKIFQMMLYEQFQHIKKIKAFFSKKKEKIRTDSLLKQFAQLQIEWATETLSKPWKFSPQLGQ